MIRTIVSDGCVIMFASFLVLHPLPGDKLTAKILDKNGVEVPHTDYVLDIDGEDFIFKFKKPHRSRSGKYTLVFSLDGTEKEKDINVNFIGESRESQIRLFSHLKSF